MAKTSVIFLYSLLIFSGSFSQQFSMFPPDFINGPKPIKFGNIIVTSRGSILVASSLQICEIDEGEVRFFNNPGTIMDDKGQKFYLGKNSNILKDNESLVGIKLLCEGPGKVIYVVNENNNFGIINYNKDRDIDLPPFNFPHINGKQAIINQIYIDKQGTLYIGANTDTISYIENATNQNTLDKKIKVFSFSLDKDSNLIILPSRPIKRFSLGPGIIPYSFGMEPGSTRILLIGTNKGLYRYDKQTGKSINYLKTSESNITVTHFEFNEIGSIIWFSTLEKGMGKYELFSGNVLHFPYPKLHTNEKTIYPVQTFSRKSANEFFVAIADSLPAVFNTDLDKYFFINDTIFYKTANKTSDIKANAAGNVIVTKDGGLFSAASWITKNSIPGKTDSSLIGPYIKYIMIAGTPYNSKKNYSGRDESLKQINLNYNEAFIDVYYSCRGIHPDSLIFAWKLDNFSMDWLIMPYSFFGDRSNVVNLGNLQPGRYVLHIKARSGNAAWLKNEVALTIYIAKPYWQTWWFWTSIVAGLGLMMFLIVRWTVQRTKKKEKLIAQHERELLELEAQALRAQMNPHFIFNCLNSIKSLIQKRQDDKAVTYLTTFSKLIRTIFQNSDKREITLFDEIETCRLYTDLECLRFGINLDYSFNIDETIDLKSIMVPALIIQPFIENAIWHGLMPKEEVGMLNVNIYKKEDTIYCEVEDNGIGRALSMQNKFTGASSTHQSKGVHLTQSRLELSNSLNQRDASIEILDKTDASGQPTGTRVILSFEEG